MVVLFVKPWVLPGLRREDILPGEKESWTSPSVMPMADILAMWRLLGRLLLVMGLFSTILTVLLTVILHFVPLARLCLVIILIII
jgi:hypothetical protein